jgi:hypothetical protein
MQESRNTSFVVPKTQPYGSQVIVMSEHDKKMLKARRKEAARSRARGGDAFEGENPHLYFYFFFSFFRDAISDEISLECR